MTIRIEIINENHLNSRRPITPAIGTIASHVSNMGFLWELIVTNDGSTDETVSLIQDLDLPNVRLFIADRMGGRVLLWRLRATITYNGEMSGELAVNGLSDANSQIRLNAQADLVVELLRLEEQIIELEEDLDTMTADFVETQGQLLQLIEANVEKSAKDMLKTFFDAVEAFRGEHPPDDDQTLIVIKVGEHEL